MSGEELDKKLKGAGYVLADIARQLGVPPQSVNQTLNAKDVKSGFLEDLCRVLNKDMSFFYGDASTSSVDDEVKRLREENAILKAELSSRNDVNLPAKDSRIYNLWMKFMQITMEMQELYKEEKER